MSGLDFQNTPNIAIGKSIWHHVETSTTGDKEAKLLRTSRHGRYRYALVVNGDFDNYYYNSNDAFNALERWEVRNGILPKAYNPEKI